MARTWAFLLVVIGVGCGSVAVPAPQPAGPSPPPAAPQQLLRIVNSGPADAGELTVVFPNAVRVAYGDVAAGATTEHRPVPQGVYRYAAYRLRVDGEFIDQPVIDWVGERPMDGRAFTYTIDVDPSRPRNQTVRLLQVTRDE